VVIFYYAWCVLYLPLMLWLSVPLLKRLTFPPSNAASPRRNVPDCKQTSEVN
jgi:hypothetical protein